MQLDPDNPWPGLESFVEDARGYFYGRAEESASLFDHVLDAAATVLYGRSGLGKTSLLRAGLFPLLRDADYIPLYVRLEVKPDGPPLARQLQQSVRNSIRAALPDAMLPEDAESLWEYLHRKDFELWSAKNRPLTPVLVIDQFEELFTLGDRLPDRVREFMNHIGDLVENRIPADLVNRINGDKSLARRFSLRSRNYKVVVCLREDFLPNLQEWCELISQLGRSRVRLLPLQTSGAIDAVHEPAQHLMMTKQLARLVVTIVAGEGSDEDHPVDVEPALLSLFCRELNEERKRREQQSFDEELIGSAERDILPNHYASCVRDLPGAARFIEEKLITEKGFRNSYARDDALASDLTGDELTRLIDSRLLRLEDRYGAQRIELTHDVLTKVVREYRDRRRTEEEAEREKAALAAQAESERRALADAAAHERAQRLESQARAGRRFRRLSGVLALMCVAAVALAVVAGMYAHQARVARAQAEENARTAATARDQTQQLLDVVEGGIAMRQAVLTGDTPRIEEFLRQSHSGVRFTVAAVSYNYRDSEGHEQFRYTLRPDAATLPKGVAAVTYRINLDTFRNVLFTTGPDRGFTADYDGWGCINNTGIVVLIEFLDPRTKPELTRFNMCEALDW